MVVSLATQQSRFGVASRQTLRWMDEVLSTGARKYCPRGTWTPSINVYETSSCYWVVAELAGVNTGQMELRVEKDVLVLLGHRDTPQPPQPGGPVNVHLMEIDHGNFCRTVKLPPDADASAIEATYRNGLLWVRIPKKV